jgi:hypothetical protein
MIEGDGPEVKGERRAKKTEGKDQERRERAEGYEAGDRREGEDGTD